MIGKQADFAELSTMKQYRSFVETAGLNKLDISILCLNAGIEPLGPIDRITDEQVEATFNVNSFHVVYLMKVLTQQMLKRNKRSTVLITSASSCS